MNTSPPAVTIAPPRLGEPSAGPVVAALEERLFDPDFRPEWELTEPLPLEGADYLYEFAASLFL